MGARYAAKILALAALSAVLRGPSARAQPGQTFDSIVKMLDSPDLSVRDAASDQLAKGERFSLNAIEKALANPGLSAEQRQRLRTAGQQSFARSPRAAMGVSFLVRDESGATIQPIPNYDSDRVLRTGDSLTVIDGHRVTGQLDIRQIIISHDPGDEVTLGIIRSGTPMTVTLKMGRLADLPLDPAFGNRRAVPEPEAMNGAWAYRLSRVGEPRADPVEAPLTFEQWQGIVDRVTKAQAARPEQMTDHFTGEPVRSVMNRPPVSSLAPGGQTRHADDDETGLLVQRGGAVIIQRGLRGNIIVRDQNAAQRDALRSQRDAYTRLIETNNSRINDPATPEVERTTLKIQNDMATRALKDVESQLRLLSRVPEIRP